MKTSRQSKKIRLSNKRGLSNTIEIIVNGILISIIILPECASILSTSKLEISKPTIEIVYKKSDRKIEYEHHKDEVYVVDLNNISQNIDYGQDAIGGDFILK